MRGLIIILIFIFTSICAHADPGKRRTKEDRKKARIERKYARKSEGFDERDPYQKQRDRQAVVFLTITAAIILGAMSKKENP